MRIIFLVFMYTNVFLYGDQSSASLNKEVSIGRFPSIQWLKSDEYNLLCYQTYHLAKKNLDSLDANTSFSTMLEQKQRIGLPTAIVTDIDETILSTLEFQKDMLRKGEVFSSETWKKYVRLKTAVPINGSLDYFQYLSKKGIKIIYLSNRPIETKEETFELLKELGYPINKEDLLLKDEKEGWTKNKAFRRDYVAKKYRVIQMFGDHLTDFAETNEQAIAHKDKFGTSWFLLPNPTYGKWFHIK